MYWIRTNEDNFNMVNLALATDIMVDEVSQNEWRVCALFPGRTDVASGIGRWTTLAKFGTRDEADKCINNLREVLNGR